MVSEQMRLQVSGRPPVEQPPRFPAANRLHAKPSIFGRAVYLVPAQRQALVIEAHISGTTPPGTTPPGSTRLPDLAAVLLARFVR